MKILIWAVQILLAAIFLMAGFMKSTQSIEQLSAMLPWAKDAPAALVRFIGISEVAGAPALADGQAYPARFANGGGFHRGGDGGGRAGSTCRLFRRLCKSN